MLGDAVLDAIVNSTLVKFAMDRKISPYEIHHAKSNLVNNDLLCKVACFYGMQRFILSGYSNFNISDELMQTLYDQHDQLEKENRYPRDYFEGLTDRKNTFWDHKNSKKKKRKGRGRRMRNKGKLVINNSIRKTLLLKRSQNGQFIQ